MLQCATSVVANAAGEQVFLLNPAALHAPKCDCTPLQSTTCGHISLWQGPTGSPAAACGCPLPTPASAFGVHSGSHLLASTLCLSALAPRLCNVLDECAPMMVHAHLLPNASQQRADVPLNSLLPAHVSTLNFAEAA